MYQPNPSVYSEVPIVDLNRKSLPESILQVNPPIRIPGMGDLPEWSPELRPYKEWTRHIVAQEIADKPKKKSLLILPSSTGRDIDILKYYNVTEPNATWVWVERDERIAEYFQAMAKETQLFSPQERVLPHKDSLHTLQLRGLNLPLDFAWFDLVGNITWPDLSYFLHYFRFDEENLADVDLFFTFAARGAWRGGTSFGSSTPLFKLIVNSLLDLGNLSKKFEIEDLVKDEYQKLRNLTPKVLTEDCDFDGSRRSIITRSCSLDDVIITHLQLFKYIFSSYRRLDFDCNAFIYQDPKHHEMVLYHLSNFRKNPETINYYGRDPIDVVIKLYENKNKDDKSLNKMINEYIVKNTGLEGITLSAEDITRWRLINKLSDAGKAEEFDFGAELEENLFNTLDDWPTALEHLSEDPSFQNLTPQQQIDAAIPALRDLLTANLGNFITLKNRIGQDIIIEATPKGIKISTPTSPKFGNKYYQIDFGTQTLLHNSQHIQIIPRFLHQDNTTGLEALFRVIFMGDPYLHPQLCAYIDPASFNFTAPQETALSKWVDSWNAKEKAGVIVLPTGMGKTTVAVTIAKMVCEPTVLFGEPVRKPRTANPRILFLADQAEILDQAVKNFLKPQGSKPFITPEDVGIFYAECYSPEVKKIQKEKGGWGNDTGKINNLLSKIVFASTDSLGGHLDLLQDDPNSFSLIIVDEAHHSPAPTWKRILDQLHKDSEYLLGITATPFRMDDKSVLEPYGDNILYSMLLNRGVYLGYLVWAEYHLFMDQTVYSKKHPKPAQVEEADYQDEIIQRFTEHARHLKTVGFCKSKDDADSWSEAFNTRLGIRAASLHEDTKTQQRKDILANFKAGNIQVLFVKDLFNEGVDVPDIEAILFLRKTESAVKQLQQLGRGLRLAVGKRKLVVLDFTSRYNSIRQLLEMMSILGFNFRTPGIGGGDGPITDNPEIDAPRVKFVLSANVEVFLRNSFDKEAEKQLEAYIHHRRMQGARVKDIHVDAKTSDANAITLDRVIKKVDKDIAKNTPAEILKMKSYTILYETLEYLFSLGKDAAYEEVKPAGVTPEQFGRIWSCLENKIPKSECVRQIMETKKRLRRKY